MTLLLGYSILSPAHTVECSRSKDFWVCLVGSLAVGQHLLISVAWRIREVDAVVVVGIEVDEPSVNVGIETDASHCERCATLAHIHHVSLVLVNLSTL